MATAERKPPEQPAQVEAALRLVDSMAGYRLTVRWAEDGQKPEGLQEDEQRAYNAALKLLARWFNGTEEFDRGSGRMRPAAEAEQEEDAQKARSS